METRSQTLVFCPLSAGFGLGHFAFSILNELLARPSLCKGEGNGYHGIKQHSREFPSQCCTKGAPRLM